MLLSILTASAIMSNFKDVSVTRTIDGDTFKVHIPDVPAVFGEDMSVRVKGIDSPEMKAERKCEKADAVKSKAKLEAMLTSGTVDLLFCESDKFYRILCFVMVNEDLNVGDEMLKSASANYYMGETKIKWKCS